MIERERGSKRKSAWFESKSGVVGSGVGVNEQGAGRMRVKEGARKHKIKCELMKLGFPSVSLALVNYNDNNNGTLNV